MGTTHGIVISVRNLVKSYGTVKALRSVSFEVCANQIFGLLGPNGAGKTTTVEILEGMRVADAGEVVVDQVDVLKHPDRVRPKIGIQLQSNAFFDDLTLDETLRLYGQMYGYAIETGGILEAVGLDGLGRRFYKQLSGGQKQRFSIAIAVVNDPNIVFLDEPSTGLDPVARRALWNTIENLRERGKTIILTTHYMEEAEVLCDCVAIVNHGCIVAMDSPAKLVDALLERGFKAQHKARLATLEDVFIDLTGKNIHTEAEQG